MMKLLFVLVALASAPQADELQWFQGAFTNALGKARRETKPVFVYFWAPGSDYCERVWSETISTPTAATELAAFLCYSADAASHQGAKLVQRFNVTSLPTMLVLGPDGAPEDALVGYISSGGFTTEMRRIQAGQNTVSAFRERAADAPDDLQRRFDLALKLRHVGLAEEGKELLASIQADDPAGETVVGAQLALWDVQNAISAQAADPNDPNTFDLAPMYAHLSAVKPDPIRFQGWDWLAQVENVRGDRARSRANYEEAWTCIPETTLNDWGFTLVDLYWGMRAELTERDRAFVLEVGTQVAARVEALADAAPADRFGMDDERFAEYLASVLALLARCQTMNGLVDQALATIERCVELDPENGEYRSLLELVRAGEPKST